MHDSTQPAALLAELAPILDLEALVQHDADEGASWDLIFDEGLLVEAFHDPLSDKLVLTTHLGIPSEDRAPNLHKLLLQYNYLWRDTSGTRMSLEPPDGNVVMIYDLSLAGLDGVMLRNVLQNFTAAARAWKIMIEDAPSAEGEGSEGDKDDAALDSALFIRV